MGVCIYIKLKANFWTNFTQFDKRKHESGMFPSVYVAAFWKVIHYQNLRILLFISRVLHSQMHRKIESWKSCWHLTCRESLVWEVSWPAFPYPWPWAVSSRPVRSTAARQFLLLWRRGKTQHNKTFTMTWNYTITCFTGCQKGLRHLHNG